MNKLKDNRKWIIVMLLSIITLGIYGLYLTIVQIRDTNIACEGDDRKTAGLVKVILLGIITFGIYFIIWDIKLISRWQNFAETNNEQPKYSLILHIILSYVLSATGIAAMISSYFKLAAFNQMCRIYNNGGNSGNNNGKNPYLKDKNATNPSENLWGWKNSPSSKL
jgi:uncharacterized membrane protein YjgN (DUF898 family)